LTFLWTSVTTAIVATLAGWRWGWPLAYSIIVGAALGAANVWLLTRAVGSLIARAHEHRPAPGRKWAMPAVLLLKWPAIFAIFAVLVVYTPARPEGVGLGVLLALAALSAAAVSLHRRSAAKHPDLQP
jgi:hypothetical protein